MGTYDTMPSEVQSNNEFLGPNGDTGYSSELNRSSKRYQTSKIGKEKVLSPRANQFPKLQDKFEVENPSGQPYIDLHPELKWNVDDEILIQMKCSGNHQKEAVRSKASKDDELVKHMSNLPGYLQRVDRGENHQDNALNFGVLDWGRLEKWKYRQKHIPARDSMNAASTSNTSSLFTTANSSILSRRVNGESLGRQSKQHTSLGSNLDTSHVESLSKGVKPSQGKVMHTQDYVTGPKSTSDGQQKLHRIAKSSVRDNSVIMIGKEKRKDLDQKTTSEIRTSSSNSRNFGVTLNSKKKMSSWDGESKKRAEESQELGFDFAYPNCPDKRHNIVLLLPRDLPRNSCSELSQHSEPRTLFGKKMMNASRKSFSGGFSPGDGQSAKLYSEIPHSCPLPCGVETNAHGVELPSDECQISMCSKVKPNVQPEGKYAEENKSKIKPSNSTVIETSRRSDPEHADLAAAKGRNQSPNRRFGIGLGRMSRSFSLKETSAVPQLISTYITVKSGPLRSEASACLDDSNREKAHAHSRGRSSPLRRLLDPLLKPKVANLHSADTVQPSEGNLNSISFKPIDASESLPNEKDVTSIVHALLQLTIKNGLPLFKFVVDDNNDVLATTVKRLTESRKDECSWIYTFYSVREMKKKKGGGWINQGNKGKSCGYVYNVVGQMKISSSKEQNMVRESVLFSVDLGHADQETPVCMPNRELAAIVIKIPSKNVSHDAEEECSPEDRCFCTSEENTHTNSTTVILPSGIHGLPNKGLPSPLVDRWKSGGSCDCGGWDVGCKLRVLTNQNPCCKVLGLSKDCPIPNHFDLFNQGRTQENRPIFSLVPFKNGIYSVKFNASISLLQAFSICVAVINSQRSSDRSETSNLSEARPFQEPTSTALHRMSPTRIQGEAPAKYVPYPPLSPVGRV